VPRTDPAATQQALDRYYDGGSVAFDTLRDDAERFELEPGVGVYFPSFVPHWVATHAGVSVSFSIPFYTQRAEVAEDVNRLNTHLRRLHLTPHPPGESRIRDSAKVTLMRSWARVRSLA
jgi:hypothetical protein